MDQLYERLHRKKSGPEEVAYKQYRYDAVLNLVERDLAGKRRTLRSHLPEILKPDLKKRHALATHRALLTLARDRTDRTRLVTTNFDNLFVKAEKKVGHISAPHLPTPKQSRWDGVVYLHGLMGDKPSPEALNRLVLTSGDFGLAYLTERWASRFVSELFAKYTVCFVGYSADDVVLRYMLDALSADELLGEKPIEVFSFASAEQGKEEEARENWRAKGVTPIIYDSGNDHSHSNLHETLRSWAETYRDGLQGRRGVALREARLNPDRLDESGSTARLIWALNEPSGEIAKAFATAEPAPPIGWLAEFTEHRFGHSDLPHFGITCDQIPESNTGAGSGLKYSLLHHPSAPAYARWTTLVGRGGGLTTLGGLDPVSIWLGQWLCRHLDKSEPILWAAQNGGRLHPRFEDLVRNALRIPGLGDAYRRIWEVIAAGYAKAHDDSTEFHQWAFQLPPGPIGTTSKLMLYRLLEPRVTFREPFSLRDEGAEPVASKGEVRVGDIVAWSLTLEGGHPHDVFERLRTSGGWPTLLVESLPVFTQLLKTCVDLMALLDGASPEEDLSVWHQPSIAPHEQNRHFDAWTALIELCREAWNTTAQVDAALALGEFERWRSIDYVVFRRLAMYCAATNRIIPTKTALELLAERNSLWSENCKHEAIQLLMHLAPKVNRTDAEHLLRRIAKGPSRKLYPANLSKADWKRYRERFIWVRLTKWRESNAKMSSAYQELLDRLDEAHPEWLTEQSERLEFRSWMSSGTGDWRTVSKLPRDVDKLAQALMERKDGFFETDDWSAVCSEEPELARSALQQLIQNGTWPASAWRDALNAPVQGTNPVVTVANFGKQIAAAPDSFFVDTQHSLPWWLRQQSEVIAEHDAESFLGICRRVLDALKAEPLDEADDVVGQAINHPIGRTVEALINYWYKTKPQAGQGLVEPYRGLLQSICSANFRAYRPGVVIASANLHSLFLADPGWTRSWLLPWFDATRSPDMAPACWEGYLWVPRIGAQLFREMSEFFSTAARQYDLLGKHKTQFASLLVWTIMEVAEEQDVPSLTEALGYLPPPGVAAAADTLAQAIVDRKETLSEYLANRVRRVYPGPWPKSSASRSEDEAEAIALFCVRTGDQFETWVRESKPFLQPFQGIYLVVKELSDSGLCEKRPDAALELLLAVVPDNPYPTEELSQCLAKIKTVRPKMVTKKKVQRLLDISRTHTISPTS
ncbi:SIR2 family protein [Ralstonia pseudosolanacearum]|uniref:SIR2 family protein n=1 Tax=Ralstonia pseudosolanacearum TaxID=1310165 RepID=UPI002675C4D0|nr:SIR2 family protein [Ralstonia pseudosolanacearum]MDO3527878.1 SIR2 family protein [Ralstonia pseudosolanacearum]MDO3532497.1 SIR2 family protein [Ralstonia pseudosolanacearum]